MGFTGAGIFANDHSLDVLIRLAYDLERQIEEGVTALEQAGPVTEEETDWQGYDLLVLLDEQMLALIALLTALCSDPIVRAMAPVRPEIVRWQEVVHRTYEQIQRLEQQQTPRPEGSMLANELPGRRPSHAFWPQRERETEEVFNRLLGVSTAW